MKIEPKIIIFDAFGTLVKIGTSRSPYRKFIKSLKTNGSKLSTNDATIIMSQPVDIAQLALHFGQVIPKHLLNEINDDLQFKLNTIELFEDTIPTLQI